MNSYHSYTARCTPIIRMKFLSCFPGEARDIPTSRTSGALLPRLCEQTSSLDWVRVVLTFFPPPDQLVFAVRSPVTT